MTYTWILYPSCIPRINFTHYILLDLLHQCFVEDFLKIYAYKEYWSGFFYFLIMFLSGFGIRFMLASKNELGNVLPFIFWKSTSKINIIFSKYLIKFSSETILFWRCLFICLLKVSDEKFNLFYIGLFIHSISSRVNFDKLCFSKNVYFINVIELIVIKLFIKFLSFYR